MLDKISDNWPKLAGLAVLAVGFSVFQYFFVPISIDKDERSYYVNPTSIFHGSDKIKGIAEEFCNKSGKQVSKFQLTAKAIGGKNHNVYRFDCIVNDK